MKWTDSECLRLVELFNDGLTDAQVGMKKNRIMKITSGREAVEIGGTSFEPFF